MPEFTKNCTPPQEVFKEFHHRYRTAISKKHLDGCFWGRIYIGNIPAWLLLKCSCKHIFILRREYNVKYFFQRFHEIRISRQFHCVNYQEMFMIYFLKHFMKNENSENRFSEFSLSWKTVLLNLFLCLINYFLMNDVCEKLKESGNKVKSKHKMVFPILY